MKPQLGSSSGFKKRSLLRPSSGLTRDREYLKTVDISQSEPMISSTIRSELSIIQQSINLLDKDKRIRGQENSLQKSYVGVLKKWTRQNGSLAPQLEKEDDDSKILKHMGAESYQTGFRKLWKVICNLDLMISKIMQLQIVHLIKYDDMFHKIGQDSEVAAGMLSVIAKGGFNPAMFHVIRIQLERSNELYGYVSDMKRKTVPEGKNTQTSDLIHQLQFQNQKLSNLLAQMQAKAKIAPKAPQKTVENKQLSKGSSLHTVSQLQQKYTEYIKELNDKLRHLQEQVSQSKVYISNLEKQIALNKQQLQQVLKQNKVQKSKPSSGSFQEALQEEMQKMKNGFERKIKKLLQEHENFERESRKRENQYRLDADKQKWEKTLLMKKFDLLVSK